MSNNLRAWVLAYQFSKPYYSKGEWARAFNKFKAEYAFAASMERMHNKRMRGLSDEESHR